MMSAAACSSKELPQWQPFAQNAPMFFMAMQIVSIISKMEGVFTVIGMVPKVIISNI